MFVLLVVMQSAMMHCCFKRCPLYAIRNVYKNPIKWGIKVLDRFYSSCIEFMLFLYWIHAVPVLNSCCFISSLRPHEHMIHPLGERDTLLNGEHLYELQLAYNFHVVCRLYVYSILHVLFHTPYSIPYSILCFILHTIIFVILCECSVPNPIV